MKKESLKEIKAENARKKHADSIKYLYFSRYLMVRYCVTILFFSNLFWLIFTCPYQKVSGIIVSTLMTLFSAVTAVEQLTKMHNRKPELPITRMYLWVQIGLNVILGILTFTPIKREFFPFITTTETSYLILSFLLIGILLSVLAERRISNIMNGRDKYLKVIKTFKENAQ